MEHSQVSFDLPPRLCTVVANILRIEQKFDIRDHMKFDIRDHMLLKEKQEQKGWKPFVVAFPILIVPRNWMRATRKEMELVVSLKTLF